MPHQRGTRYARMGRQASAARAHFFKQGYAVGNLATANDEPSGMARPYVPSNVGWLWMAEDSGNVTQFMAVRTSDMKREMWALGTVSQVDCEDITSFERAGVRRLVYGDMGDNSNARATITLYRVPEPTINGTLADGSSGGTIADGTIEAIVCDYTGNVPAHKDVECIFAENNTGDLYLITKRIFPAKIYKLAWAASYAGTQTLSYLGKLACDTSATSVNLATTGAIVLTTTLGLEYPIGMKLRVASRASAANWFEGFVTARAGTSLTIFKEVNTPAMSEPPVGGVGTFTDWDISLAISYTIATPNDGCVTGGDISADGSEIVLCNYSFAFLFPRATGESIFTALARAPLQCSALPGGRYYSQNNTPPGFPQREAIAFSNDGLSLFSISEYNAAIATVNTLIRHDRATRPVTTLRLTNSVDTYIDSAVPALAGAALASIVADINFQAATNITAAVTAAAGLQTTFTVASGTGFVVGAGARISAAAVGSYVGTWEVTAVAGTSITMRVPFNGTSATGSVQAHSQDRQVLMKFDLASLPSSATIVDAVLRLFVNTEGEALSVHKMRVTWADTATWTSTGGIIPQSNIKAYSTADAVIARGTATYVGFLDIPIPPATIQDWKDGRISNFGWVIVHHPDDLTGNGYQFDSAESLTPTRKPMLILSYT